MKSKSFFVLTLKIALLAAAVTAQAKDFTQADLERLVAEVDKVIPHNPGYIYPIKCTLVAKDDVNAYAGYLVEGTTKRANMVVYTGFAKAAGGEDRIVRACIAHELTHLSKGHSLAIDPAARDLSNLWTRQQEYEADRGGMEAIVKAGHPKTDMIDMLLLLDREQGRNGYWLQKLLADHADPKERAATLADDPTAYRALVYFDTGLAYEDARNHIYAKKLFEASAKMWPALTEGYTNAAKSLLKFYYDELPGGVRDLWWRPDFGPFITNPAHGGGRATDITDEIRQQWRDALASATKAVEKNPLGDDAPEVLALTKVLEPDAKKEVVAEGVAWFKSHAASATDPVVKLRYANNAGVGLQRTDDLSDAYATIMAAQKATTKFNSALGENLGLVVVKGRSKEDDTLAINVLYTWLGNTPSNSPRWPTVKKTFDDICKQQGLTTDPIPSKPALMCRVTTLVTSNKELGLLLPVSGIKGLLGEPEKTITFNPDWKDLSEMRWKNETVSIYTEGGKAMRLTSSEPGAYLVLRPTDGTSQDRYLIKVGMTRAELFGMLNEKASVMKDLAVGGRAQQWNYFPDLGMGVRIDGDKVGAITVTPVVDEGG